MSAVGSAEFEIYHADAVGRFLAEAYGTSMRIRSDSELLFLMSQPVVPDEPAGPALHRALAAGRDPELHHRPGHAGPGDCVRALATAGTDPLHQPRPASARGLVGPIIEDRVA